MGVACEKIKGKTGTKRHRDIIRRQIKNRRCKKDGRDKEE